jgi:hypothetical protein
VTGSLEALGGWSRDNLYWLTSRLLTREKIRNGVPGD